MNLTKQKPWRSPKLLAEAKGQSCVRCEIDDGTIVAAHYSGLYSERFGRGMSMKGDDFWVAFFCAKCHTYFDLYVDGNDDARAIEFMSCIHATLKRLFAQGVLIVR